MTTLQDALQWYSNLYRKNRLVNIFDYLMEFFFFNFAWKLRFYRITQPLYKSFHATKWSGSENCIFELKSLRHRRHHRIQSLPNLWRYIWRHDTIWHQRATMLFSGTAAAHIQISLAVCNENNDICVHKSATRVIYILSSKWQYIVTK